VDQSFARARRIRDAPIKLRADRANHIQVAAWLACTDRVSSARLAVFQYAHKCRGVVFDKDPVAPV
jgi:hypothetical protein